MKTDPPANTPQAEPLRLFKDLGAAGPLAVAALAFPPIGGIVLLATLDPVGAWLRSHEVSGVILYAAAFAILAGFALLPTYAQAILGGWAFGFTVGFPAALAGFLGGSLIGYAVARRAASERVMAVLQKRPKWLAVRDALVGSGFWKTLGIVTLLRLPPNSPFAISNLVYGSTRVAIAPYIIGTILGMAPRTAIAVYIADGLRDLTVREAAEKAASDRPWWFFPLTVALSVAALVIVGVIANRVAQRWARAHPQAPAPADPPANPPTSPQAKP